VRLGTERVYRKTSATSVHTTKYLRYVHRLTARNVQVVMAMPVKIPDLYRPVGTSCNVERFYFATEVKMFNQNLG